MPSFKNYYYFLHSHGTMIVCNHVELISHCCHYLYMKIVVITWYIQIVPIGFGFGFLYIYMYEYMNHELVYTY